MVNAALTERQKLPHAARYDLGAGRLPARHPHDSIMFSVSCRRTRPWHATGIDNGVATFGVGRRGSEGNGEKAMSFVQAARAAALLGIICLAAAAPSAGANAASRIKDITSVEGVRQNQLIGYGIVIGLNGTGDTLNNIPFTRQSLQAMLERLGVNIRGQTLRTG